MAEIYEYDCSIVRVVDGDSVVVTIDLGFRLSASMPIRLVGLNAPELSTSEGKAVKKWTVDWFAQHTDLRIETMKDPEKYGRWLGVISPRSGGRSLNAELVAEGMAVPWDGHGPRPTRVG